MGDPYSHDYADLSAALLVVNNLRAAGERFVTMVAEDPNMVGGQGAAIVKDGKLPNGEVYSWTKNDRVGAAFKNK